MLKKSLRYICILLLLISLIIFFLPYWDCSGTSVSIGSYILRPYVYSDLTKEFRELLDTRDFQTNAALPLFLPMLLDLFGTIAGSLMPRSKLAPVFCIISGILTFSVFLSHPIVAGGSLWFLYIAVSVLTLAAGILQLFISKATDMS